MAIESVTRRTLRSLIADALRDNIVEGTATAGGAATLTDTANVLFTTADALKDAWIFIHTGTSVGDEFGITASSTSSVVTVPSTPGWSTTPDTTSEYEIHRKFRVREYNRAIDMALRRSRWAWLTPKQDTSLLTNSNLLNPLFTNWNAAGTLPASWTNSGANFSQNVVSLAGLVGKKIGIKAVLEANDTDWRLQVTDGTTTVNDAHDGSGWDVLEVEITPVAAATALTCRINHSTGSSLTLAQDTGNNIRGPYAVQITESGGDIAVLDSMFTATPFTTYDYTLPDDFHAAHLLEMERGGLVTPAGTQTAGDGSGVSRRGRDPLLHKQWTPYSGGVNPGSGIRLEFDPHNDRALTLHGLTTPAIPTADTDVITANVDGIVEYAVYYLNRSLDPTAAAVALNRWREARDDHRVKYPSNSRIINPL